MKQFNVLDRKLSLHQHYLLEASAGTGKTFSIQNIVVRLLIESHDQKEPLLLQKILIVTFTRAATQDLTTRIRANIEQALHFLQSWLHESLIADQIPDYLKACIEKGDDTVKLACKRLQQALFTFDQAQIFTIHSFCARMLRQFAMESDLGLHSLSGDEPLPQSELMTIIRDFFRTEVRIEQFSPAQLEILLKEDPNQRKLLKIIQSHYLLPSFSTFREIYLQFKDHMQALKKSLSLTSKKMIEDFQAQASSYRNYKAGETKAETLAKIIRFAQLFDKEEWSTSDLDGLIRDGMVWNKALDTLLLKTNSLIAKELHYPELTDRLKTTLHLLIEEASDFATLLARMALDCQQLLRRYQQEEEKLSPDDILRKMHKALNQNPFLEHVRASYQAAIIDEFQDTDPLQWQIFRRLFISDPCTWKGYIYLVGDPKQSIYSFRQADIYTYLEAAQILGESHCFSLDVNYRSQSRLVQALNVLFANDHVPQLMSLPKKNLYLSYQPVKASMINGEQIFDDARGSIHFFIADGQLLKKPKLTDLETQIFFPFIAQEIARLKKEKGFAYHQFAVLVRDRHQALRLAEFFDQNFIPCLNQRGTSLAESPALQALTDLIRAILHPRDRGAIRTALGSPLMGWTHEELKNIESMEFILLFIQRLKSCLFEKGFATFFQELLRTISKPNGQTIQEQILEREGGLEFYRDLQQIVDIVIDHQYQEWNGLEGIIPFLDQFKIWEQNDDKRVKRFQDSTRDGVKILTLHFSKGLEFEIVFALGLVNHTGFKEDLIPIELNGQLFLTPSSDKSEEYQRYYEENDAEKMRQLYVALTRAKYQLYIPVATNFSFDLMRGEASPMDLFLAHLNQPNITSHEVLYERMKSDLSKNLINFLETIGHKNFMTYSVHQKVLYNHDFSGKNEKKFQFLQEPSAISVIHKPLWMTSFSTLSQYVEQKSVEHIPLLQSSPHDFNCLMKNVHTLPANSETGLLIHHILEKITFYDLKKADHMEHVIPFVRPFVQKSLFKEWESVIATLIFNTLKTPLPQVSDTFCLAHLESTQFYREIPFVFPYKKGEGIEEIDFKEGLIKGVIDLLFYHEGFYYLVDWKTNWLGIELEAYESASLEITMKEHSYFLQAAIYTEAVKRYLKLVDPRPFEECFGGIFYLFLRGLQPGKNMGIYHFFNSQSKIKITI